MKILEGPEYLMTTLMRFHYDRTQNRKSKVFTEINYELELNLPVYTLPDQVNPELYSLYAIVVHSGYSSDGGHYYTYAREPLICENSESIEVELEGYALTRVHSLTPDFCKFEPHSCYEILMRDSIRKHKS